MRADNPFKSTSSEKRIVQPGRYDQVSVPGDIVGMYYWHQPLSGSECALSNAITGLLNGASALLGRKTRFELTLAEMAKIDFAVAEPTTGYELKLYAADEFEGFIGLGFAGSNQASFFCKAQHIRDVGWIPISKTIKPVTVAGPFIKLGAQPNIRPTRLSITRLTAGSIMEV